MDILIVGGGYAGLACATRLARLARQQRSGARIRLVNPDPVLVERIRLHQAATGQKLRERRLDTLLARAGVEWVPGRVEALDPDARTVRVNGATLHWDRLVLANGSHAGSRDVPGAAEHAFALEPEGVPALQAHLRALPAGASVVVVGGGLTGIEAASEIAEAFPRLRLVLASRGPLAEGFSAPAREYVRATLEGLQVQVREGVAIERVAAGSLHAADGAIPVDACLWTAGFRLTTLARDAGLRVNAQGQVLVDPFLRSVSHPHVYAAGDTASPVLTPGQPLPLGCKSALPAGTQAGENLARELRGEAGEPFDYALLFYCVSLGRRAGLIQWADATGALTGRILTGARGALFKETICRMTWWSLVWESRGRRALVWKGTGQAPRALPASS